MAKANRKSHSGKDAATDEAVAKGKAGKAVAKAAATIAPATAPAEPAPPTVTEENVAARAEATAARRRAARAARSVAARREAKEIAHIDSFDPTTGDLVQRHRKPLDTKVYNAELAKLQIELVKLQEWVKARGLKVVC